MSTSDFFQDSASSLNFEPIDSDSKNFLLLLPGSRARHSSTPLPNQAVSLRHTPLCRPQARRLPFSLAFTPVSEPDPPVRAPNRCRLLGFTPLAEKTSPPAEPSDQSFCGQPTPRAKECAPCALFFTRADVFVSTEMVSQGLLAPSHDHYSPLQISLSQPQPQPDPIYLENYFDQENELEDEVCSATSSPATSSLRFWDGPATSATSTRASSPVSSLDFYCPTLAVTSMPIPMPMMTKKRGMRRARSLLGNSLENETDDCWADDEEEEINFQQTNGTSTRRMSEPSGGKPKMSKALEL
ncbi:hypothetical protein DFH28DRAFT_62610 [Melampsora americana]|nr:hypothetical protein DFH28DRAFT_62610 [Melampsora americana]